MRKGTSHSEAGKLGAAASLNTAHRLKQDRITAYKKNPTKCKACDAALDYEHRHNKFCNHACSATFNNKGVRRHGKAPGVCKNCSKPKSTSVALYCSIECQHAYSWSKRKEKIKRTGTESSSRMAKRYLIEEHGIICSICSSVDWMGQPISLELDHIDGNSDNNNMSNQRLICGNCGMQLPTYKGANRGNGRYSRRQRYKDGKSY